MLRFLSLVSQFIKGNHLSDKRCEPYVKNCRCKRIEIETNGFADISVDGEIYSMLNPTVEIIENAIKIILPCEKDMTNTNLFSELKA